MHFFKRGMRKTMLFYREIRIPHTLEPGIYRRPTTEPPAHDDEPPGLESEPDHDHRPGRHEHRHSRSLSDGLRHGKVESIGLPRDDDDSCSAIEPAFRTSFLKYSRPI